MSKRVVPQTAIDRPPTTAQMAREIYRLSPEWTVTIWKALGDPLTPIGVQLTGAVMRETFQRGPNKGRPSWAKRDLATEMTISLSNAQMDAWYRQWEIDTSLCHECSGSGMQWMGWSRDEGTKYRKCKRCNGTGRMEKPA